jgi:hypothetical protein
MRIPAEDRGLPRASSPFEDRVWDVALVELDAAVCWSVQDIDGAVLAFLRDGLFVLCGELARDERTNERTLTRDREGGR